jgi:two-component system, NtrC family, nitrogen regulation sensor histidine kinase NtrY
MTDAYEDYTQLRVLKPRLTGLYLSLFLMLTLMILVSATWMGLYLAKRITRPIHLLACRGAEIGAGHLDHRIERENADEFGSLIDAFNAMAGELAAGRRRLERSTVELQRKHLEGEARRRYIETILERVATGVISVDTRGRISTVNSASVRLLELGKDVVGQDRRRRFRAAGTGTAGRTGADGRHQPSATRGAGDRVAREWPRTAPGRCCHGTARRGWHHRGKCPRLRRHHAADARTEGGRLARGGSAACSRDQEPAHTDSAVAERLKRHFSGLRSRQVAGRGVHATIIGEVESLKGWWTSSRSSPACRRPPSADRPAGSAPRHLALYNGLFGDVRIETVFDDPASTRPARSRTDTRVVINLVDNAVEAINRSGRIVLETGHAPGEHGSCIVVADDGPGIPEAEREKLFLPYYSTKRRGSGLGLAIVRRIVAEHGGSIEVADNQPRGTRFTIELPC